MEILKNIGIVLFIIAMALVIFRLGVAHGMAEIQRKKNIRNLENLLESAYGYNKFLREGQDELVRLLQKYLELSGHKEDSKNYLRFLNRVYTLVGEK